MEFFILIILIVFMFDEAKFRKQNDTLNLQNEKSFTIKRDKG